MKAAPNPAVEAQPLSAQAQPSAVKKGPPAAAPPKKPARPSVNPTAGPGATFPSVSVIVTTLNRSELLPIALRSIQLQNLLEWECIVVDDHSTDHTVTAAQRFVDKDDRFRVVRHHHTLGLAAARNTGLAAARAEYVCFLDDDDFLLAGSLSERLKVIEGTPSQVVGSFCDWINTDPHVQLEVFDQERKPTYRGSISFSSLRSGTPFIATSPLLRRRPLLDVGGFDESFRRAEDSELWHRLLRLGFKFLDARHVGVAYRRSPGSMVTGAPLDQLDVLQSIEQIADAPAPDISEHGPAPVVEPLSYLTPYALRAPTVYRYLAMIALQDPDAALAIGRERIPAPIRAEIDQSALRSELIGYVRARCGVKKPHEVFALESAVTRLVTELTPTAKQAWTPTVDAEKWLSVRADQDRGQSIGRTPQEVETTAEHLDRAIVLVVEAVYHVDEFGPLYDELERRGLRPQFMLSPKTVGPASSALGAHTSFVLSYAPELIHHASAVLALNDWGPVRELIARANSAGIPTFAKVEGVQDFEDLDTGRLRQPYQAAAIILGQGQNDVIALPGKRVEIVGSSRLERIWLAPAIEPGEQVLVNLNFTYHVLTDRRSEWIASVRQAIDYVGASALVSAHPAERSRNVGLPFTEKPFRHAVTKAGLLISRFSTVPFEAMARGVPFVYHNPHGERVTTFKNPGGAFRNTTTSHELADAIRQGLALPGGSRDTWADFFLAQVDVDERQSSESRTADLDEQAVQRTP